MVVVVVVMLLLFCAVEAFRGAMTFWHRPRIHSPSRRSWTYRVHSTRGAARMKEIHYGLFYF